MRKDRKVGNGAAACASDKAINIEDKEDDCNDLLSAIIFKSNLQ